MALASGRCFRPSAMRDRLLDREVARGPGVGVAEAEQQINVGGPGADAVQRGQRGMRLVGLHRGDRVEVDMALRDRLADRLDRLDLGVRKAEPLELVRRARAARCRGGTDRTPPSAGRGSPPRSRSKAAGRRRWRRARHSRPRGGAAPACRTFPGSARAAGPAQRARPSRPADRLRCGETTWTGRYTRRAVKSRFAPARGKTGGRRPPCR